jgi:hypothetical protein
LCGDGVDPISQEPWSEFPDDADIVTLRPEHGAENFCSVRSDLIKSMEESRVFRWEPAPRSPDTCCADQTVAFYRHPSGAFWLDQKAMDLIKYERPSSTEQPVRRYSLFQVVFVRNQAVGTEFGFSRMHNQIVPIHTLEPLASTSNLHEQMRAGLRVSYRRESFARAAAQRRRNSPPRQPTSRQRSPRRNSRPRQPTSRQGSPRLTSQPTPQRTSPLVQGQPAQGSPQRALERFPSRPRGMLAFHSRPWLDAQEAAQSLDWDRAQQIREGYNWLLGGQTQWNADLPPQRGTMLAVDLRAHEDPNVVGLVDTVEREGDHAKLKIEVLRVRDRANQTSRLIAPGTKWKTVFIDRHGWMSGPNFRRDVEWAMLYNSARTMPRYWL